MPNTPVYTEGIKYIKIAKQDSGSVDNSIELQDLTDIRIKFSDIPNPVQYNVASISEYSTHYLYSIFPLNITSSADQEILNYKISASSNSFTSTTIDPTLVRITDYNINTNPLNYLNSGPSGTYTLGNTPNVTLNVTNSIKMNAVNGWTFTFALVDDNLDPSSIIFSQYLPSVAGVINGTITGSFTPVEGNSYGFFTVITGGFSAFTSSLIITQSYAPESSNYDITVLEPYTSYNFYNSDCNVIQNNVDVNNISPLYMDVDFNGGQIVAQNQAAILSGNASRAQVQPWNYSYYSQISGRYVGKQQNAININTYTSPTSYVSGSSSIYGYTGSWPGDSISPTSINPNSRRILERSSPGNVVIQWLDSCIYEINWGGPGYPENVNGGGLSMGNIYLVGDTRDDVAIIKPGTDIYYDILEKTFPSGSPAFQYQYINSPTLPTQLNITYPSLLLPSATYYFGSNSIPKVFGAVSAGTLIGNFHRNWALEGSPLILFNNIDDIGMWPSYITQNGYLAQSNQSTETTSASLNIISSSLSQGEKWFLSLYSGSGTSSSPDTGLLNIASGSTNIAQYGHSFEIESVIFGNPQLGFLILKTGSGIYDVDSFFSGSNSSIPIGRSSSLATTGFLITKAQYPTNGLTIFGPSYTDFAGAGKGYILSQYPKQVITQNIDYILKTYGNKPT
jgi:hypothetical protein